MRLARIGDYKRRLAKASAQWSFKPRRFSFTDLPTLGTGEFPVRSNLQVICGPNGVGKTTILRAIWAAATSSDELLSPTLCHRFVGGAARLDYTWADQNAFSSINFTGQAEGDSIPVPVAAIHIDGAWEPKLMQDIFCAAEALEDIVNGVGARRLTDDELSEVSSICKREYREVTVYEIDQDDGFIPFFEVSLDAYRYDSRTMGAGELAALYIWWSVDRADEHTIVFVEEPETFLSPGSQKSIIDFLIVATVSKYLTTIITSHSPVVIQSVSDEHQLFVYRDGATTRFQPGPITPALLMTLGIVKHVDIVCLVEDIAAQAFLRRSLLRSSPLVAQRVEIQVMNGHGPISAMLTQTAGKFDAVRFVGVYDGDAETEISEPLRPFSALLPFKDSIEISFKQLIGAHKEACETALGVDDLGPIIFGLQGTEPHDWYNALCQAIGTDVKAAITALYPVWEGIEGNTEISDKLAADILLGAEGKATLKVGS